MTETYDPTKSKSALDRTWLRLRFQGRSSAISAASKNLKTFPFGQNYPLIPSLFSFSFTHHRLFLKFFFGFSQLNKSAEKIGRRKVPAVTVTVNFFASKIGSRLWRLSRRPTDVNCAVLWDSPCSLLFSVSPNFQ